MNTGASTRTTLGMPAQMRYGCGHYWDTPPPPVEQWSKWQKEMCPPCLGQLEAAHQDLGWPPFLPNALTPARATLRRAMTWTAYSQFKAAMLPVWEQDFTSAPVPAVVWDVLGELEARFLEYSPEAWVRLGTLSLSSWFDKALAPRIESRDARRWNFVQAKLKTVRQAACAPQAQPNPFYGLNPASWAAYFGRSLTVNKR